MCYQNYNSNEGCYDSETFRGGRVHPLVCFGLIWEVQLLYKNSYASKKSHFSLKKLHFLEAKKYTENVKVLSCFEESQFRYRNRSLKKARTQEWKVLRMGRGISTKKLQESFHALE